MCLVTLVIIFLHLTLSESVFFMNMLTFIVCLLMADYNIRKVAILYLLLTNEYFVPFTVVDPEQLWKGGRKDGREENLLSWT